MISPEPVVTKQAQKREPTPPLVLARPQEVIISNKPY